MRPRKATDSEYPDITTYEYLRGWCSDCYLVAPPAPDTVAAHQAFFRGRAARSRRRPFGRPPLQLTVTRESDTGLWKMWRYGLCIDVAVTEIEAWNQIESRSDAVAG